MTGELAARSLALLLASAVLLRLRPSSPLERHRVASLSLLGLLLLAPAAALLPPVPLGVLPASEAGERRVADTVPLAALGPPAPAPAAVAAARLAPAPVKPARSVDPLALLWAAGAVALLGRAAVSRVLLVRLRRRAGTPSDRLRAEVAQLARRTGLRRSVRLVSSPELGVPSTWGIVRPVLAVPLGFERWEAGRRRRIVLHELAHVARWDAAWGLVAEAATALFWWNPLAWYLARCARDASEGAADTRVLAAGARASDYADDLVAVARALTRPVGTASLLGAGRGRLRARIEAVLDPRAEARSRRVARVAVSALTVVLVGAAAIVVPVAAAREASPGAVSAAEPASGVAAPPWPAHQVRWAQAGEAGALFLEGEVDLAELVRSGRVPAADGLLVWYRHAADGGWNSLASGRTGGVRWSGGSRDDKADPAGAARALAENLREVAPGWTNHPDTSIGSLSVLPALAGRPPFDSSGSVILGVPGSSRDPGTGVLQAGWYLDGERIGVFARGPLELSRDGGALEGLPADGWLAAFGWAPDSGRLRSVEVLPGAAGGLRYRYTEDGVERPFGGPARAWLGRVLAGLPGREPGLSRVSWRQ